MVNGILNRGKSGAGAAGTRPKSSQSPQATCQFPMRGLMKNMLTVTGSGCVALGHPARPPKWLPETGNQGGRRFRTPVSNSCGAKSRQRRRNEQATPIPSRKRTAGASRVTRVPVANNATGTVSRRCREQAKEIAAAPGAAARHGLEFMFEAQVFQGKSLPNGSQGSIRLARRRSHVRRPFGRHRPPRS